MYDAIVVGARCAGSPTAMLLARKGHRVLVVDRATFPSDTVSTHIIQRPGVAALSRWGLLDRCCRGAAQPMARPTRSTSARSRSRAPRRPSTASRPRTPRGALVRAETRVTSPISTTTRCCAGQPLLLPLPLPLLLSCSCPCSCRCSCPGPCPCCRLPCCCLPCPCPSRRPDRQVHCSRPDSPRSLPRSSGPRRRAREDRAKTRTSLPVRGPNQAGTPLLSGAPHSRDGPYAQRAVQIDSRRHRQVVGPAARPVPGPTAPWRGAAAPALWVACPGQEAAAGGRPRPSIRRPRGG